MNTISSAQFAQIARDHTTPLYVYDEAAILARCAEVKAMPSAFGLSVGYAMKANANRALLQLIHQQGIHIDASSLNEARRAHLAGIPWRDIMLTTQEVQDDANLKDLETMMTEGLRFNVCSHRQLTRIADFAAAHRIPLARRVHPGEGSGESATRNTGDHDSSFGVHLSDMAAVQRLATERGVVFDTVHVHIGSGGDPEAWRRNIDRQLDILAQWFPQATRVNFGGGFKVARMPDEADADIQALGAYAKARVLDFYQRTGRRLHTEVEPGTFYLANAGYLLTRVIDKKQTGAQGHRFVLLDGGMEVNTRPLLYGARHPFWVISPDGHLRSSDFAPNDMPADARPQVVVGRCCESGDAQTIDAAGRIAPRIMAEPDIDDLVVIGGVGAYAASMSPFNYNSHLQAAELLLRTDGRVQCIRQRQTMAHMLANELPL